MSTIEIMDKGMACLIDNLGEVDAEHFISVMIREKNDYTKWRQNYFGKMDAKEFHDEALAYAKQNGM